MAKFLGDFESDAVELGGASTSKSFRDIGIKTSSQFSPIDQEENVPLINSLDLIASRLHRLYKNNIGLLLIAVSQSLGCGMNLCVKLLNSFDSPLHPLQLVSVRMIVTYIAVLCYMLLTHIPHPLFGPPEVRKLLVFRGLSGFFGLSFMWLSLRYLALADAITLTFLIPSGTAVVCFYALHETMTLGEICAGMISLLGVIFIAQPEFIFGSKGPAKAGVTPALRLLAVGYNLIGVVGGSFAVASIRIMGKRPDPLHTVAYFAIISFSMSTAGMLLMQIPWVLPVSSTWLALFILVIILGFTAQFLLVLGLQREKASRGMLGTYVQVVFAMILDSLVFNTQPTPLSFLGTGCIIGSAIYVAVSKQTDENEPKIQDLKSTWNC